MAGVQQLNAERDFSAEDGVRIACEEFAREAARSGNRPEALHEMIIAMHRVCSALTRAIAAGIPDKYVHQLAAVARETAALSPFVRRLQECPRGYAGDFETIEYILRQEVRAPPATAAYWIELHSLTSAIVQQHRNKVFAQAQKIAAQAVRSDRRGRILVLAAGSSPDIWLALPLLQNSEVSITVVDSDPDAIEYSRRRLASLHGKLRFIPENVLKVGPMLQSLGPFDLVLAGGLLDYLPTRHAAALIRTVVCELLAPDGRFFFTNMTSPNPYRGWMRHVANWRIFERSPDDMRSLVANACGEPVRVDIEADGTGLALFIECSRPHEKKASTS